MDIEAGLSAIARGDRGAFTQVYRFLHPVMTRYAIGLLAGDRAIAEDVVNEAFVAIWQQASHYAGLGSATGWVRRIVRNKAIDYVRKQRDVSISSEAQEALFSQVPDQGASPEAAVEAVFEANHLRKALVHLSFEQREAIWLCYFEDKSIAQIAQIADCPENTVKTRLFHARKILRAFVSV
jgi:RNA polymerase sigma-70 factor, ECF subfamily